MTKRHNIKLKKLLVKEALADLVESTTFVEVKVQTLDRLIFTDAIGDEKLSAVIDEILFIVRKVYISIINKVIATKSIILEDPSITIVAVVSKLKDFDILVNNGSSTHNSHILEGNLIARPYYHLNHKIHCKERSTYQHQPKQNPVCIPSYQDGYSTCFQMYNEDNQRNPHKLLHNTQFRRKLS